MNTPSTTGRDRFVISPGGGSQIAVQRQRPERPTPLGDLIYVHGSTFGADLSVFFALDGRSWADELAGIGLVVWGFDFVGYGASSRHPADLGRPAGDIHDSIRDLRCVVQAVRAHNGGRPVVLLAHSRGAAVAARYAEQCADDLAALVLFAPVVKRVPVAASARDAPTARPSHCALSVWAQYRRFIEDVPRGEPQMLDEAHMQAWGDTFLASDPTSSTRMPPSVTTPFGPVSDIMALWSGEALYEPAGIVAPTLLIRGQWDSVCNDDDAANLLHAIAATVKRDIRIARATHLMHLERQRVELHAQVNAFLREVLA
jgi:alpha-beta hydrolase superfamily lysophospholipase